MNNDKKSIKIKFTDFPMGHYPDIHYDWDDNIIIRILSRHYNVEISDKPEYVIFSNYGYGFLDYDCIRIQVMLEYITPDFRLADYAIGFHSNLKYEDCYFNSYASLFYPAHLRLQKDKILNKQFFEKTDLEKKNKFAIFIHQNGGGTVRNAFFDKLSEYKEITAAGLWKNNIGYTVKQENKNKLISESKFYFSMSNTENSPDERITEAYQNKTIPIYWGDKEIGKKFNTKGFINCHDFHDFDAVYEKIKEIDNNDDLYISMMRQPVFAEGWSFEKAEKELEEYLIYIFDQEYEKAFRRKTTPLYFLIVYEKICKYGDKIVCRETFSEVFSAFYFMLKRIAPILKRKFISMIMTIGKKTATYKILRWIYRRIIKKEKLPR